MVDKEIKRERKLGIRDTLDVILKQLEEISERLDALQPKK